MSKDTIKSVARIGSVSHGTTRPQDLIPIFMDTLDDLKESLSLSCKRGEETMVSRMVSRIDDILGAIEVRMNDESEYANPGEDYWESLWMEDDYNSLEELLNEFAPEYCYFGAHEGDGTDYGFWPSWDQIRDDVHDGTLIQISGMENWPDDEIRERKEQGTGIYTFVMEVNDHGNCTLYNQEREEIWSIV